MDSFNELSLFSGIGGGLLGGILCGFRTICAVEKEPYCREVLLRRQRDGMLPLFPIWDDIKTFDGRSWSGSVDIITAGFPCQPFSVAGRRKAKDDERNLWPDTIRVIREVGPRFCLLENVTGLLGSHGYFGQILGDLAESGYDAEWDCVSASACGAPHQRDRLWILAYNNKMREPISFQSEPWKEKKGQAISIDDSKNWAMANSIEERCSVIQGSAKKQGLIGRGTADVFRLHFERKTWKAT